MIPIKIVGNTYLKTAGNIRPTEVYEAVNLNKSGGKDVNYQVTFRITEACDLHCSYCHWNGGKHYSYSDITLSIDRLFEFFQKHRFKSVVFYYHGGEATRHPKVVDILKYIKDKSKETGIIAYNEMQTNLTMPVDKLTAILEYCDQLDITFHYLELKNRSYKLKAFLRNWQSLTDINYQIHNFDVMLEYIPQEDVEEFYNYIETFLTYDNIINSEMVYRFGYNYAYNAETDVQHKEFYKKHNKTEQSYNIDGNTYNTNDLFRNGLNCINWNCAAGTETITINGDGNVFNCGIHMTGYVNKFPEMPYTNLVTDPLALNKMSVLYKTGTRCKWDYCGGDFYLSRTKPNDNT
jgi:MoaA/NifB/PqqE/SkfB family radical SAM enzyme